jgi:hypothetical protein
LPLNVSAAGTTTVRAAGFAAADGRQTHVESRSVLVRRPHDWREVPAVALPLSAAPLLWDDGDDHYYRVQPTVNASWINRPLSFNSGGQSGGGDKTFAEGLGLRAPMHLNYNLSEIRRLMVAATPPRPLTRLAAAVAVDTGCDAGGAGQAGHEAPPFSANCHDIAEWQHAILAVYVDGRLEHTSPVLQAQTLQWNVLVALPPAAEVAMGACDIQRTLPSARVLNHSYHHILVYLSLRTF